MLLFGLLLNSHQEAGLTTLTAVAVMALALLDSQDLVGLQTQGLEVPMLKVPSPRGTNFRGKLVIVIIQKCKLNGRFFF